MIKIIEIIGLILSLIGVVVGWYHRNIVLLIGICLIFLTLIYIKLQLIYNSLNSTRGER